MLKLKARNIRTQQGDTRRWYITGTCPYTKRRVRESTGTDSRDEAQNVLAAYLTRARDEATQGPANGTALFAEAVVEYLGKKGEARFLDPLLVEFGKLRLRDITDQALTLAGDKIYPGAKASTLVRQLYGPMQAVWNAAVAAKMAPPRVFAKPKVKYRQSSRGKRSVASKASPCPTPTRAAHGGPFHVVLGSAVRRGHQRPREALQPKHRSCVDR